MRRFALTLFSKYQDRHLRPLRDDEAGMAIVEYALAAAMLATVLILGAWLIFGRIMAGADTAVVPVLPVIPGN